MSKKSPKEKKKAEKGPTKEELLDHLQRLQAEFDNYRKRTEEELVQCRQKAADRFLEEFLPILDNLTLALDHTKEDVNGPELLKGVLLIKDQFLQTLESQGVEEIQTENERFDPTLHEALMTVDSDKEPGSIIETFQRGYTRKGRVLRPAKVSVAK